MIAPLLNGRLRTSTCNVGDFQNYINYLLGDVPAHIVGIHTVDDWIQKFHHICHPIYVKVKPYKNLIDTKQPKMIWAIHNFAEDISV